MLHKNKKKKHANHIQKTTFNTVLNTVKHHVEHGVILIYQYNIMRIPNYDAEEDTVSNFKQLYDFMPHKCFRMLICGPSGSGKTNTLMHMIYNMLYFDKVYLYAKNLEQSKYQNLMEKFQPISDEVGYDVIEARIDEIIPVENLESDSQKIVIFDDYVCDKNQKPLVDYFNQRET